MPNYPAVLMIILVAQSFWAGIIVPVKHLQRIKTIAASTATPPWEQAVDTIEVIVQTIVILIVVLIALVFPYVAAATAIEVEPQGAIARWAVYTVSLILVSGRAIPGAANLTQRVFLSRFGRSVRTLVGSILLALACGNILHALFRVLNDRDNTFTSYASALTDFLEALIGL